MKRFLLSLCLLGTLIAHGQSKCDCFDRLNNLGYYYSIVNKPLQAIEAMKDALTFLDSNQMEFGQYNYIGILYLTVADTPNAIVYFTKEAYITGSIDDVRSRFPTVYSRMDTNAINKYLVYQQGKMDLNLYSKFVEALTIDQALRGRIEEVSALMHDSSAIKREAYDSLFVVFNNHVFHFLKSILEQYGYPTYKKLGFNVPGLLAFTIHASYYDSSAPYIFNKFSELNKNGDYPLKSRILFLKDKQRYSHDGKTYAGVAGWNRFFNIVDINKADSLRLQYNQIRIREEAVNDSLPKEYHPIPYPKNYFCLKKYRLD